MLNVNTTSVEGFRRKAEKALNKPAKYGLDLDVSVFQSPKPVNKPLKLLQGSRNLLEKVGVDLEEKKRSGTYYQLDEIVGKASSSQPGLKVLSLNKAFQEGVIKDYFHKLVPVDKDKYTAVAALKGKAGYVNIALQGERIKYPVQTCFFMSSPNSVQAPHNMIIAEENSEIHVITGCLVMPESVGLHAGVTEIYVKRRAKVTYTMIHSWNPETHVRPRTGALVEENGQLIIHYINLTPVSSLQTAPEIFLKGRNAKVHLSSVIVSKKKSNMDVGGTVFLEAEGTSAEIISRVITKDEAEVVTRGEIIAKSPKTKGHIECNGLMLSKNSKISTIPVLRSESDDVELTHEAAVGKLKEDEIFYLTSKGLTRKEAASVLVRGFMKVKVEGLPEILSKQIEWAINSAASGL